MKWITRERPKIDRIACLTGFSDQRHFNRIFKKIMGVQPSVYRKSFEKGKKDTRD